VVVLRGLFRDIRFDLFLAAGAIATFCLFVCFSFLSLGRNSDGSTRRLPQVAPFFIPLYATSLGLSNSTGAALVAGYNLSSAFGRLGFGFLADVAGPLNSLFLSLVLTGVSLMALWPISTTLAPFIVFVILNVGVIIEP
jgi:hypothetical protein